MNKTVEILKNNLKRLMRSQDISSPYALAKLCKVDQKTANNLISENGNPKANPTIKVVEAYAKPLDVEAWMLLMNNFPFDAIKNRNIKNISEEGYILLYAFENAPEYAKYSMLDAISVVLSNVNPSEVNEIKKRQSKYLNAQ